jgi:hypothetical protein
MPDMRYLDAKEKFLGYAWDVYSDYYDNREVFLAQFTQITNDKGKNKFLKITSFYKFLIRDSTLVTFQDGEENRVDYLDDTYKYIAIMAFIEDLLSEEKFMDFFNWLSQRKIQEELYPIINHSVLQNLYNEYKENFGATKKAEKFFAGLDDQAQNYLTARITINEGYKPAEEVAKFLYEIRSEFVHRSRLIVEFVDGTMYSRRRNKEIMSILSFSDLSLLFEHGLLQHFGFEPTKRKI